MVRAMVGIHRNGLSRGLCLVFIFEEWFCGVFGAFQALVSQKRRSNAKGNFIFFP